MTVSFGVKLPHCYYECVINKRTKCSLLDATEPKNEEIIHKTINPNQLVYVIKEFTLMHRFRGKVYRFLRSLNQKVVFHVIEPKNGGLVDKEW